MSKYIRGGEMDFVFKWFEKKYTVEEITALIERIKEFNAGVIDKQLSMHVDRVFKEWLESK